MSQRVEVVNGTLLQLGGFSLRPEPSPEGTVLAAAADGNAITLDVEVANPGSLRDTVVIIGNDLHQTSYTITAAETVHGRTQLHFGDTLFIVGMGAVAGVDPAAGAVTSDRQLSGYGRIDGGRHAGRWLLNEGKSRGFRIASIEGRSFTLEEAAEELDADFSDADGDGRRLYWISDIGPGDTFRIPMTTSFAQVGGRGGDR